MSEGVCSGEIAQVSEDVRRVGRKNSVDMIEDISLCTLHQVSWRDLRRELFDVVPCAEGASATWPEAEYRDRLEGFDVVASGCSGGGSWAWSLSWAL